MSNGWGGGGSARPGTALRPDAHVSVAVTGKPRTVAGLWNSAATWMPD